LSETEPAIAMRDSTADTELRSPSRLAAGRTPGRFRHAARWGNRGRETHVTTDCGPPCDGGPSPCV